MVAVLRRWCEGLGEGKELVLGAKRTRRGPQGGERVRDGGAR